MHQQSHETSPRIPVTVLTGFLGSGKTTLLNRLLRSPGMANTVVIVNEFGEVGLDHLMIETPRDEAILLENGCLCCAVLGDMVATLTSLLERRDAGQTSPFERIVIETSGMADPSPLLQTLVSESALCDRLDLAAVITLVDAVNGAHALERHLESVKQVAAADRIVLGKLDIASPRKARHLEQVLEGLNPEAEIVATDLASADLPDLMATVRRPAPGQLLQPKADGHSSARHGHRHGHAAGEIRTISVTRQEPASRDGLRLWMNALSRFKGPNLLRMKGIVNVEGAPFAVNAVQRVFHEPVSLKDWPSDDRSTRIVFIANGLEEADLASTTEALGFRPSRDAKIDGLDFAAADYRLFVDALKGFSVAHKL